MKINWFNVIEHNALCVEGVYRKKPKKLSPANIFFWINTLFPSLGGIESSHFNGGSITWSTVLVIITLDTTNESDRFSTMCALAYTKFVFILDFTICKKTVFSLVNKRNRRNIVWHLLLRSSVIFVKQQLINDAKVFGQMSSYTAEAFQWVRRYSFFIRKSTRSTTEKYIQHLEYNPCRHIVRNFLVTPLIMSGNIFWSNSFVFCFILLIKWSILTACLLWWT